MPKNKDLSLASRGLKYKLKISFYLMSILPLLVCVYLVSNYILPKVGLKLDIAASLLISIFIAISGFFLIKEVFDRIVSVSSEAKMIAAGDLGRRVQVRGPDEVGDLSNSLNQLTQRIRNNMSELKSYSEKTTEINLEIQKRVLVLSSLLHISSLISQGADLDEVLKITVEKARLLANSDVAYLFFREETQEIFSAKAIDGLNLGHLWTVKIDPKEEAFHKIFNSNRPFVLDKSVVLPENTRRIFYDKFKLRNALVVPVYFRGRILGIFGIGNVKENFLYNSDDIELLDIFAKQVAIAIENDILTHRIEKLEIKDVLTGLYNEPFISSRLEEEIKRAITYQRPCAFILLDIDNFSKFYSVFGSLQAEATLKKVSSILRDSVTEIDRVARTGDNEFAILLPEKNKRQAQETAENIRKKIEFIFSEEQNAFKRITISAGVSENPIDGIEAAELISKAKELLKLAKKQGKNRISVKAS